MGIFGKKQIEDKPLPYHAGVIAAQLGSKVSSTQLIADQPRFGGALLSVLNLYAATLGAPALPNMFAIGAAKEYSPLWDKEFVREVMTQSAEQMTSLKDAYVAFAKWQITETDLINAILRNMGKPIDQNLDSKYDEGMLFTAHQLLADLGQQVQSDTFNGQSGQQATDAMLQGVVAANFLALLFACETVAGKSK